MLSIALSNPSEAISPRRGKKLGLIVNNGKHLIGYYRKQLGFASRQVLGRTWLGRGGEGGLRLLPASPRPRSECRWVASHEDLLWSPLSGLREKKSKVQT
jgi:hypothetical protein